jgi:HAD superfamily hydrolase (TIGR01549 family)/HAD superfamily hydrolase (TIGR01509 family)
MSIQAVLFDMGGTIETYTFTRELRLKMTPGIQQRLLAAGIDLGLGNKQLYEVVSSGLARYRIWSLGSLDELSSERVWCEHILPEYAIDQEALASIAEDLMCYIETQYYHREMRPEMPFVLESIRQMGLKIGLISNINSLGQVPANLTKYNLKQYFDPIVLSSEYGRRKPDPAIFHYAARLANVPTSRCLYVGDRITRDILGARNAGFGFAVQINHDFDHGEIDEGATPDFVINQMTELLVILQTELNRSIADHQPANMTPNPVRALLFDAGDMLYYRAEPGCYLKKFLEELGLNLEENHAVERFTLRQQAYRGQIDQEEYQETLLQLYGITQPEQVERGLIALKKDENNVQFFDGVKETLFALKDKGYLLGIVTDTANPVHAKLGWFERGGFGHVWDSITSSTDIGVRKPNAKIYHAALKQLGVSTDQAVFLGHKTSELEGARAVGMKTIAFNYDEGAPADYYVEKFADILQVALIS